MDGLNTELNRRLHTSVGLMGWGTLRAWRWGERWLTVAVAMKTDFNGETNGNGLDDWMGTRSCKPSPDDCPLKTLRYRHLPEFMADVSVCVFGDVCTRQSALTPLRVCSTSSSRARRRGRAPRRRERPAWSGSPRNNLWTSGTQTGGRILQTRAGCPCLVQGGWRTLAPLCWCRPKDRKNSFSVWQSSKTLCLFILAVAHFI